MGLNFRKRVTILPGLTLNFGKRGTSVTVGKRGTSMTFGKNGTYANVGIPGTGISYRERISKSKKMPSSNHYARSHSYSSSSYTTSTRVGTSTVDDGNVENASTKSVLLLICFSIGAIVMFYLAASQPMQDMISIFFLYSVGAIFSLIASIGCGFSINTIKGKESNAPLIMGALSLIVCGLAFFIWAKFWPETVHYSRHRVWGSVPETADLGGWKTFANILSWISIIVGVIVIFITMSSDSAEKKSVQS